MKTNEKFYNYLEKKGWVSGKTLLHNLEIKNPGFYLLDYSTLSLRDICESVGYYWLKDNNKDNAILSLDSTIAYFKGNIIF